MPFLKAHVHLNVGNAASSVAFYEKLLGSAPVRRRSDGASFDVSDPPFFLVIQEEPRSGVNVGHLGLLVESADQLQAAESELRNRGLSPERRGAKLWLEDPDGNGWEILVRP